jgi:hypothetical protein
MLSAVPKSLRNAGSRELCVLCAAARERGDEATLARAQRPPSESRDLESPLDPRLSAQAEARKFIALDLFGDGIA